MSIIERARSSRLAKSAMAYTLLILLGVECGSRVSLEKYTYLASYSDLQAREQAIAATKAQPSLVFLGSSHPFTDVDAAHVSLQMHLAPGDVLNAGVESAGTKEMLYLYKRNRTLFRYARFIVIDINDFEFNRNALVTLLSGPPEWRAHSGLLDRLTFPLATDWKTATSVRMDWLIGWIFSSWDQRQTWKEVLTTWVLGKGRAIRGRQPSTAFPPSEAGPAYVRPSTPDGATLRRNAKATTFRHMEQFKIDNVAFNYLTELLALIRADGHTPLFISYPLSPAYHIVVREHYSAETRLWQSRLKQRFPTVRWLDFRTENQFAANHYWLNSDHLSLEGARAFSLMLAQSLLHVQSLIAAKRLA